MTDTTSRLGALIPKADGTDPFVVHTHFRSAISTIDSKAPRFDIGSASARASATHVADRVWRETDTGQLYYDDGAGHQPISRRIPRRLPSNDFPTAVQDDEVVFAIAQAGGMIGRVDWPFVYDGGLSDAYKWMARGATPADFVGSPFDWVMDGALHFPPGLAAVMPFAGYYRIRWGINLATPDLTWQQSGGRVNGELWINGGVYEGFQAPIDPSASARTFRVQNELVFLNTVPGASITVGAQNSPPNNGALHSTAWDPRISLTPIRVRAGLS